MTYIASEHFYCAIKNNNKATTIFWNGSQGREEEKFIKLIL